MKNNPHKTAIARSKVSKPMQRIMAVSDKRRNVLDYGCGRGSDVDLLKADGWKIQGFDPHFYPTMPRGNFFLVTCNYVLNVLDDPQEREDVIKEAWAKVKTGGTLFLSVRSKTTIDHAADIGEWACHKDGYISSESKGTFQKGFTESELENLIDNCELPEMLVALTSPSPVVVNGAVTALIHKSPN